MIAVASCFSQLLSLVDRGTFARAVRRHQAERGTKGFSWWDQFGEIKGLKSLVDSLDDFPDEV
jgi:hypothetical protein